MAKMKRKHFVATILALLLPSQLTAETKHKDTTRLDALQRNMGRWKTTHHAFVVLSEDDTPSDFNTIREAADQLLWEERGESDEQL